MKRVRTAPAGPRTKTRVVGTFGRKAWAKARRRRAAPAKVPSTGTEAPVEHGGGAAAKGAQSSAPSGSPDDRASEAGWAQRVRELEAELQLARASAVEAEGARLLAVQSTRTGVAHFVAAAGTGIHVSEWRTVCGWRFAAAPHLACSVQEVRCRVCAALGQVGVAPAARALPPPESNGP